MVVYKENVSGHCSLAEYVIAAHSCLRFGLDARQDGLRVQPVHAMCPLPVNLLTCQPAPHSSGSTEVSPWIRWRSYSTESIKASCGWEECGAYIFRFKCGLWPFVLHPQWGGSPAFKFSPAEVSFYPYLWPNLLTLNMCHSFCSPPTWFYLRFCVLTSGCYRMATGNTQYK